MTTRPLEHDYAWSSVCPFCGYRADAASKLNGRGNPVEGDVSLCVNCCEFGIFALLSPGGIRKPTDAESLDIASDRFAQAARNGLLRVKAEVPPGRRL